MIEREREEKRENEKKKKKENTIHKRKEKLPTRQGEIQFALHRTPENYKEIWEKREK